MGGFIGENVGKTTNCYSTGNVQGNENVGGFVGQNVVEDGSQRRTEVLHGFIQNCYSTGKAEGKKDIGGFAGINKPFCMILSCFWDKETSELDLSAGGFGKTTAEMMQQKTFEEEDWDFKDIWKIDEGKSYPNLIWDKGENPNNNSIP